VDPGASVEEQFEFWAKLAASAPARPTVMAVISTWPEFVRVMLCAGEVLPVACAMKVRLSGAIVSCETDAMVLVMVTFCTGETPPPTPPVITATFAVPATAMSEA
jgi:hypothetical protein